MGVDLSPVADRVASLDVAVWDWKRAVFGLSWFVMVCHLRFPPEPPRHNYYYVNYRQEMDCHVLSCFVMDGFGWKCGFQGRNRV